MLMTDRQTDRQTDRRTDRAELTGYPSIDQPWLKYYDKALVEEDIPKCSAYHLLYENNKSHLDETALLYYNRKISYRQLFEKIKIAAGALGKLGVKKGNIVTLQVLNMPETVVLFYALSYLGAVANIVFITDNEESLHQNFLETESILYITLDFIWNKVKGAISNTKVKNVILLSIGEEADFITKALITFKTKKVDSTETISWNNFMSLKDTSAVEINNESLPVLMVYTSGTTGKSKAVVLTNKNLNGLVMQYSYAKINYSRGQVFMNQLPPFLAFGIVFAMHMPLCLGITNLLIFDPNPNTSGKIFAKYKPNYFVHGMLGLENIMNNKKVQRMDLGFVEIFSAGGEAIPTSFEEKVNTFLATHGCKQKISIGYGMTELAATAVSAAKEVYKMGTVGIPLPGTIVKIINPETNEELQYNQDGEICIHTPTMMQGYFNQEAETVNVLKLHEDGKYWVHTGDIGRVSDDGFVTIVGRIKRIVNLRMDGIYHKVFPKIIEEELEKSIEIESVVAVGRKKPVIEHEIVAFIKKKDASEDDASIIAKTKELANNLNAWEQPVEYRIIKEIPRTTVGKVDYRKLEEML